MLLASSYDLLGLAIVGVIVAAVLASVVVCGLKGKYGMIAGGILLHILWYVGAIRIAKPDSWWARNYYDEGKMALSRSRF